MTDKEFLEEKIRQTKKFLTYIISEYEGDSRDDIIDMLLDSINDAKRRLESM